MEQPIQIAECATRAAKSGDQTATLILTALMLTIIAADLFLVWYRTNSGI